MNDPFGNINEQTQQTITQQPVVATAPIVSQQPSPAPITWVDGVGRVTTVGISKQGNKNGKDWTIYKVGIQDNTGSERTYSTFLNPPPAIGTDINFKAKVEPYFNQTYNKMMDSRQIVSFLLTSQAVQQVTQPVKQNVVQGAPQSVAQNVPQSQEIDTFLLKYLENASSPSIYEFIGVFMVKKMSDINLVKQLVDAFNRTVQASK